MIGVNKHSLYRKLNNKEKITINDAVKIKEVLELSDLEALEIFLSQELKHVKKYKFKNAIVYVYGEISKERLKEATIKFLKKTYKYKK